MPKHSYIGAILAALLAALKFLFACGLELLSMLAALRLWPGF